MVKKVFDIKPYGPSVYLGPRNFIHRKGESNGIVFVFIGDWAKMTVTYWVAKCRDNISRSAFRAATRRHQFFPNVCFVCCMWRPTWAWIRFLKIHMSIYAHSRIIHFSKEKTTLKLCENQGFSSPNKKIISSSFHRGSETNVFRFHMGFCFHNSPKINQNNWNNYKQQ